MSRKIRINRGALLFIILLIGIITYLVVLSVTRGKDEAAIKELCSEYMSIETGFCMLPEKNLTTPPNISSEELDSYIKDMKDAIKLYYIDNENAYKRLVENLEASLIRQAGGGDLITKFNKNIVSFNSFEYRGDLVEVNIICQNQYEITSPYNYSSDDNDMRSDTIIVQKVDDEWKIVYSNIQSPFDLAGLNPISNDYL